MLNGIKSFVFFDNYILIKWADGNENILKLTILRRSCPCAFCSGEKDVFGNNYIGEKKELPLSAFMVSKYSFVGLYGVKFYFKDGHSDGIYTFNLLKSLIGSE